MKKIYLLLLISFVAVKISAQGTIVNMTVDPPTPTTSDNVKIYVDVMFTSMGCAVDNQSSSTTGSNTSAYGHHCLGMLSAICTAIDTFNLGMLPAGTHVFDMTLTSGSGGPPCTPGIIPDDNRNITFSVSLPTGISNNTMQNESLTLYPNPFTTTATIKINSEIKITNAELIITDVMGKEVKSYSSIPSNEILIDRENMNAGMYFFQLNQNGEIINKGKFVIE